jgi:transcriptional regulator with XRE-family HTH domain
MDIKTLVNQSGKSRSEICAETGMSQGFLSLIESGQRKPRGEYLSKLAQSLGVSPADIRPDLAAMLDDAVPPVQEGKQETANPEAAE